MEMWAASARMVWCRKGMCHTQYSNDLSRCPAAKTFVATWRRLCATAGAFAPPKFGYDTSSRAREQVQDMGSKSTTCRARVRD